MIVTEKIAPELLSDLELILPETIKKCVRYRVELTSIEEFFSAKEPIDYSPCYQRNYVWDIIKATFFIESVLMNVAFSPLILFQSGNKREIIDGRQRYETILRFLDKKFKLHGAGLEKLKHLAGKDISSLDEEYVKKLKRTRIRHYDYELVNITSDRNNIERLVTQELFQRYNTGITPLTQLEYFKAKYIDDVLNNYFKKEILANTDLYHTIISIFCMKGPNIELVLRKIRALLVLHCVPISQFSSKQKNLAPIYDHYSSVINENSGPESAFNHFKERIGYIRLILKELQQFKNSFNGHLGQSLFWALSICSKENVPHSKVFSPAFRKKLVMHIHKFNKRYNPVSTAEYQIINSVFEATADFFSTQTDIIFDKYLRPSEESKKFNRTVKEKALRTEVSIIHNNPISIDNELGRINLSSLAEMIQEGSFIIRPHYQRGEKITQTQASGIIESILLNFELLPIFTFKKKNGIQEVIDGQQRIIACLSFIGFDNMGFKNNAFALNLPNGILKDLHQKRFKDLDREDQKKILNFTIRIVEISESSNPNFDPIDLFMRLNFKPYPIKPNTFESWNSYINKELITGIKNLYDQNSNWFYLTKNNNRMVNEELITSILYFKFKLGDKKYIPFSNFKKVLAMYFIHNYNYFLIRTLEKDHITECLNDPQNTQKLIKLCNGLEDDFLEKIKLLFQSSDPATLEHELDSLLHAHSNYNTRSYFRFYVLYILLANVPLSGFKIYAGNMKTHIKRFMGSVRNHRTTESFASKVEGFWNKFGNF